MHHIVPRYLKGSNHSSNLIRLTYRQHILAHLLLYRKHKNIEDLTAYKLMKSTPEQRKSILSKMVGERHKLSGHIQRLGRQNAESNWINQIKTKDSLSRGGKRAGQIAKETGQVYTIRTEESSRQGGITAGNMAKLKGQIQSLSKYKGKYVLIDPFGIEYQHLFQMESTLGISSKVLNTRCRQNSGGYSRRLKTTEELALAYSNVEICTRIHIRTKDVLPKKVKPSKYIFIDDSNEEFEDIEKLALKHNISKNQVRSRCLRKNCGFSIKYK